MTKRNRLYLGAIAASTIVISYLHYTSAPVWPMQSILMDLYYLPVLAGALVFGLRGAVATYVVVLFLYLPYIFVVWHLRSTFLAEDLLHTLFFGVFALIAGSLVDRERQWRRRAEKDAYLATLGRAATTIAHELRNPLSVIKGFIGRMREKKGDVEIAIEAISRATDTMHRVLESTLDFARPLQLERCEEDIGTIINGALSACMAKAKSRGVTLSLDSPPEPIRIVIDGFLCERALVNLIDNAIDASKNGQAVGIVTKVGKDSVSIRIEDHGSGMDAETLDNVFLPFYTKKNGGTGVGMAITKKIIDEHGGVISIQSQPGRGTNITVRLPGRTSDAERA